LAETKRIWNFAIVWSLLDGELRATITTVSFCITLSILKWMLRNSESELNRNNPTYTKVRQHYLPKFKEILGSDNNAWGSYDMVDVLEILKDITDAIFRSTYTRCQRLIEMLY